MEDMKRIMREAFEVAFILANQCPYFGARKIVDLIEQIIPSAYVYGTGYWVFYEHEGDLICVCKRYGLLCKHTLQGTHCLDNTPIPEENDAYFYDQTYNGAVLPDYISVHYEADQIQEEIRTTSYLVLKHIYCKNGQCEVLGTMYTKFKITFATAKEYEMTSKNYLFFPHPRSHPNYKDYSNKNEQENLYIHEQYMIIVGDRSPKITLSSETEYCVEITDDNYEFSSD